VSWRILLEDLERGYEQLQRGEEINLGSKTTSYRQWAERLEQYSRSEELREEVEDWEGQQRRAGGGEEKREGEEEGAKRRVRREGERAQLCHGQARESILERGADPGVVAGSARSLSHADQRRAAGGVVGGKPEMDGRAQPGGGAGRTRARRDFRGGRRLADGG